MSRNPIKSIVILGGGTSGWMTAAALAHHLKNLHCNIRLIESESIGTVGVGEATLPHIRFFNQTLGIDEKTFMQETKATFKMGIEFSNWGRNGDKYIHPFGDYGRPINDVSFHHYWLQQYQAGNATRIDDYSLPVIAAEQEKFIFPSEDSRSVLSSFSYAYHLDASLYAKFLRKYSEARGVERCEGKVVNVFQNNDGEIRSLVLDSGEEFEADLFIDCSGFRALLIEQTLKTGFDDWSRWLPCDRAVAAPCESQSSLLPYTKAIAKTAGWQWRIPLQHRVGNGQVYSSEFMSDDEAANLLLKNIEGKPTADLNFIRFKTGKRKKVFHKNCVAIGLSAGFLEPLESTSLYLVQIAIMKLIELWPDADFDDVLVAEYNNLLNIEYWRVRDFLILHYHATEREDTPFWKYCKYMSIPDELAYKINLFEERGYVLQYESGLFLEPSWIAVYLGQGIIPSSFDRRVNRYPKERLDKTMAEMKLLIHKSVHSMPKHEIFLRHLLNEQSKEMPSMSARMSLYGVDR